jgi:ParB family chromosome partitioning protein
MANQDVLGGRGERGEGETERDRTKNGVIRSDGFTRGRDRDLAALEVGLIENMARQDLNPVEEARACATLVQELGLSYREIGARVGSNKSAVANLMRLLQLSEDILVFLERGELSAAHGRALLMAKDPGVRSQLARMAIEHGWSTRTLQARAHASNNSPDSSSALAPSSGSRGPSSAPPDHPLPRDGSDDIAMNIARVWGDAVGAEVMVRTLPDRKLRVEFVFESPEGALAVGGHSPRKSPAPPGAGNIESQLSVPAQRSPLPGRPGVGRVRASTALPSSSMAA